MDRCSVSFIRSRIHRMSGELNASRVKVMIKVFEATAGLRWIAAAGHRLALQGLIVWHTIRRESHSSPMNRNYERPTTGLEGGKDLVRVIGFPRDSHTRNAMAIITAMLISLVIF
ncbi:uncharacterized protein [Linepithema humile]|uniref:uncharacterized protein isoform X4 n=1 Tax=Linepithema humile TaxID=83485 RepID=UPI0006238E1F|nr:PREDICTED: uncharacterized protein LOC105667632 isoform X4 [Linepithema humile]